MSHLTEFAQAVFDYYAYHGKIEERTSLEDVVNHGCASGCGPVYTHDLNQLFAEHEREIQDIVSEFVEDAGYRNIWQYLDQADTSDDIDSAIGIFVWLAWERTAQLLLDTLDPEAFADYEEEDEEDDES